MVRVAQMTDTIEIPEGVKVTLDGKVLTVEKGNQKVVKDFSTTGVIIEVRDREIYLEANFLRKKERAIFGTVKSTINNMIIGVTKGFRYKSKIVYSHFPISVTVEEKKRRIKVESLYGGRNPLYSPILPGVTVKVEKEDVIFTGADKEKVGQTAASLQELCRLRGKRRKSPKTFMDGIYIYHKEIIE